MKIAFFYACGFFLGAVIAFNIGYAIGSDEKSEKTIKKYNQAPQDIAQACHVVNHTDSDGYKFWTCEKNK